MNILLKKNAANLDCEIYALQRDTSKPDIELYVTQVYKSTIDGSKIPIDKIEIGKHVKLMQNPNISSGPQNSRDYNKNNIPDVVEVSDIMIFNTNAMDRDINTNIGLLYRRYLTKRERESFDKRFASRY